ncbi:hypothetical protein COOONC_03830, partial [Cooperia oncophora]
LVAFRSSALHQPASGIVGDAKIQTKVTTLDSKSEIVSIGLNADETLLGVFGHNPQGCFVNIFDVLTLSADVPGEAFPISTVRIGNSVSKGLAFEWNPAVADMFAASDSERTLSVIKIDLQLLHGGALEFVKVQHGRREKCRPLHTLPRLHEFVPPASPTRFQQRLVVASKYHIAVAVANNHELVAFRSSALHQPASGIVGDAKIQTKVTTLDSKSEIVSIGLNADETLLGVFGHNPQGCFVNIFDVLTLSADVPGEAFPISTVRIGNSVSKGLAFEWNPAVADMFAASDSERTLSVIKIDLQNSSKYSMVGEKKLEANISEISWSPKGKQLVVGDVRGKIYQLKPELELVRTTNAPENAGNVVVINLSWLSTTDWLVAYSNAEMTSIASFMLSIKKDKPPSWTPLNFSPQSSLGVTRRLLVDWNIALIVSPSSAGLLAICKSANNAWTSASIAALVEPSAAKFAIGVAVDLSNQNMVTTGDGSSRRLPIVVVLYSDGSVISLQLAPPSKDYPDCNIKNGLRQGNAVAGTSSVIQQTPPVAAPQTTSFFGAFGATKTEPSAQPSAATPFASAFGMSGTAQAQPSATSASATPSLSSPATGGMSVSAAVPEQKPLTGSLFSGFQGLKTTPTASNVQAATTPLTGLPAAGKVSAGLGLRTPEAKPAISTTTSGDQKALSATPMKQDGVPAVDPAEAARSAVAAARASAKKSIETFSSDWHSLHEQLHSFYINMQKVEGSVDEAMNSLSHADNLETVEDIERMVIQLDDDMQDMLAMLGMERMALAKECESSQLVFGPAVGGLERLESERVLQKYEDFALKLHEAKKLLADTKKISATCKPRRVNQFDPKFEGRIYESMKNLSRYSSAVRLRIDELERKVLYLTSRPEFNNRKEHSASKQTMNSTAIGEVPSAVFSYTYPKPLKLDRGASKPEMRSMLLRYLSSKKDVKATIKKLEALHFDSAPSDDTLSSSFLNASNIENSLTQKITSPARVKPVLSTRNVSTQADAPAQAPSKSAAAPSLPVSSFPTKPDAPKTTSASVSLIGDKKPSGTSITSTGKTTLPTFNFTTGQSKAGDSPLVKDSSEKLSFSGAKEQKEGQSTSLAKADTAPSTNSIFGRHLQSRLDHPQILVAYSVELERSSWTKRKMRNHCQFLEPKALTSEEKKEEKQSSVAETAATGAEKKDEKPLSMFGSIGSSSAEKKDEKPSSIFGGAGASGTTTSEKKDEKPTSLFGGLGTSSEKKEEKTSSLFGGGITAANTEKKDEKQPSIFGGGSLSTAIEKKEEKPPSIFGGLTQTTPKSIFAKDSIKASDSEQSSKPSESAVAQDTSKTSGGSIFATSAATGQAEVKSEQGCYQFPKLLTLCCSSCRIRTST